MNLLPTHRIGATVLAGIGAAALATAAAPAAQPEAPQVPAKIAVEAGHRPFIVGHAKGVQIYRCTAPGTWSPVAPRANVYDDNGKLIMTHGAGPHWQARDGSRVVASRVDGVTVDTSAIQWLLLKKASATAGPDGDKLMATTFIQRVNTVGGLAPAAATCTTETVGNLAETYYETDYVFWKKA